MEGYIVLHRKILEWEWYSDLPVRCLFEHCLLKANWKDKSHKGKLIKRGTFVTGRDELARETGLTVKQVRRALNCLKKTSEMTIKSTSQGTEIIINNYDLYQSVANERASEKANEGPTKGQRRATTNKDNKVNKDNKNIYKRRLPDDFELPDDWSKSAEKYWASKNRTDLDSHDQFNRFKAHHLAKGTTSTDFKHNWQTWYSNAIQYSKPSQAISKYGLEGQQYVTGDL